MIRNFDKPRALERSGERMGHLLLIGDAVVVDILRL